ncbi:MAG: HlyD family secretion protein [Aestuariibacter sp.]
MSGDLFRKEAIEHQKDQLHGDILILPGIKTWTITGFLAIWVILLFTWLLTSQFSRKETVTGWIEPDTGMLRIYAESGSGKVKQILVAEGQAVVKGQPLVVINGDRVLASGEALEEQLLSEYQQQRVLLQQQLQRTENIFGLRQSDVEQQIMATQQDIVHIEKQLALSKERHQLLSVRVAKVTAMHLNGHLPESDVENIKEQELALQSELKELSRKKLNQQNQLQQLEMQLAMIPQELINQSQQIQHSLSELAQKIAQLHGQRAYVVKATQPGSVSNIQVQLGQYSQSNTPLLTIIPANATLQAKVLVPVRSAGFIEPEQQLDIRYDAFPYQKFGMHNASVSHISVAPLLPNEIHFLPVDISEPVYQVTAQLDSSEIMAYGEAISLKPGMTFNADVTLSQRSILEWLLEPIYSIKGKL